MIGPTDLLRPSPTPHFSTFQVFLIYCPKRPTFNTIQNYAPKVTLHYFLPQFQVQRASKKSPLLAECNICHSNPTASVIMEKKVSGTSYTRNYGGNCLCEVRDGAKETVTHILQSSIIKHIPILHHGITMCVELSVRVWLHASTTLPLPLTLQFAIIFM